MKNNETYFILSSNCKLVNGAKRSIIIDYGRGDIYFLPKEYFELVSMMDRGKICDVELHLSDVESKKNFEEFLAVILSHEIGFLTDTPEQFPGRDENIYAEELTPLIDVIIEIDPLNFDKVIFSNLCADLNFLKCKDFQIRLFSTFDFQFLSEITKLINASTANYLEIHCNYSGGLEEELHNFIEQNPIASNIYLYGSPDVKEVAITNNIQDYHPLQLGKVYYINYPFNDGNCCGVITKETLDYSSIDTHNLLKKRNGCLDRKLSIDRFGNIKNCPSMKNRYGNIKEVSIREIITKDEFKKFWHINKDQISICNVCEFRYNCTDCRAFLQNPTDIFSKPLKCGYNPYTCTWDNLNYV
jgi:SPASM domain peptide maturase of grasp-with-spasm system